jgi:hypothetical protein
MIQYTRDIGRVMIIVTKIVVILYLMNSKLAFFTYQNF